jgi:excisionase family DNA binding protein
MADKMGARVRSVDHAAKVLGIGRNSAYEAIRRGEIPAIRIGRRLVVPVDALERLLQQGQRAEGGLIAYTGSQRAAARAKRGGTL